MKGLCKFYLFSKENVAKEGCITFHLSPFKLPRARTIPEALFPFQGDELEAILELLKEPRILFFQERKREKER